MKLIFVAGPYRADCKEDQDYNCWTADQWARKVAEIGGMPVSPHNNTPPHFEDYQPDSFWLEGYQQLLVRCDALLLIPGWEDSPGTLGEYGRAMENGIPVFTHDMGWTALHSFITGHYIQKDMDAPGCDFRKPEPYPFPRYGNWREEDEKGWR